MPSIACGAPEVTAYLLLSPDSSISNYLTHSGCASTSSVVAPAR
jgi:hypothetical protein